MLTNFLKKFFHYFGIEIKRVGKKPRYIQKMFDKAKEVEGDVVECGVGKMSTFRILADILQNSKSDKKLWGFDSFEGFPEPSIEDVSPRGVYKGEWKHLEAEDAAKFLVVLGFKKRWVDSHIIIVKGFFKDTLPQSKISKISFLHLDVDLYESYKICLKHLFPKVSEGGVVLFDEYEGPKEEFKFPGAKKAIDEYFKNTKYKPIKDKSSGKYFLVK